MNDIRYIHFIFDKIINELTRFLLNSLRCKKQLVLFSKKPVRDKRNMRHCK